MAADVLAVMDDAYEMAIDCDLLTRAEQYREARAAMAELIAKADNAATALSNLIAARQVDERYEGVVTDLTAALARISGEGA